MSAQELAAARRLAAELAELEPGDLRLVAALVGVRAAYCRAEVEFDAYYDPNSPWHRNHVLPEYSELQRLRYPPNGDRAAWVRDGPPGHVNYAPGQAAAA
jgi:hypothetical protein